MSAYLYNPATLNLYFFNMLIYLAQKTEKEKKNKQQPAAYQSESSTFPLSIPLVTYKLKS